MNHQKEAESWQKRKAHELTANGTKPHPLVKDLTDQRFGMLTVLSWAGTAKNRQALWLCSCDCGNETTVRGSDLVRHRTISCGCFRETDIGIRSTTHGQAGKNRTSMYTRWLMMKRRCYHEGAADYPRYGGRGIRVCDEWRHDFQAFADYMGEPPGPGYSMDRINNDGNYEPGNVRWATAHQQRMNQRRMKRPQIAEALGIEQP